jgi:glycosyltransferase involved in cell wall biosynthesis
MVQPVLSVVVPAYNEQQVLPEFHRRTLALLRELALTFEIVYVDDGSSDGTMAALRSLYEADPQSVVVVSLSRNFGKEAAMTAGLEHARGDAVVVIDADLQDPPELMAEMLAQWRAGYDVVYARRRRRHGETFLKRMTAHWFYRVMGGVSRVSIPHDAGDFRLLSRRATDALLSLREQHRFMKGLFSWIGFRQLAVEYERDPRFAGETKWNYWRLWNYALEGITSFTTAPLKVAMYLGFAVAGLSLSYAVVVVYKTIVYGNNVRGYPSLMVAILFFGGVQLLAIGVLGEYLGRTFNEAKRRPLYFVGEVLRADPQVTSDATPPTRPVTVSVARPGASAAARATEPVR